MDRGERLLDAIQDDVCHRLNPSGDECWHCGGEGFVHDCFDGFCEAAEEGCEDCSRTCPECVIHNGQVARAVREEVIKSGDTDIAIAWLKSVGRWSDNITRERVIEEMAKAAEKGSAAPPTFPNSNSD